jgi:NADH:ubiquinone oxidoreductase subunit 2 (subunit N)
MSLVPFLIVCAVGAVLGLLTLPFPRLARLVGVVALAGAFVAALAIKPVDELTIGQVQLATSWYSGLFLSAATASCLIVCLLGLAVGWPERLAPAALATFGGLAVAFTATDPGVVFAAVAAAAVPAALVAIGPAAEAHSLDVSLAELRTLGVIATGALLASVLVLQPGWTTTDPTFVFALAYLALGAAIAVRFGAVPFHVPAARLSSGRAKLGVALPLVWIPSGLGIVALSWSTTVFQMQSSWLDAAIAGIQIIAVATLVLGALGALLHNELEEIAIYSIVQDAAFVLLALAARDAAAAEPTRLWLLTFIVAKSALIAWVSTLSSSFGSSRLQDLRGWVRKSPILGLALIAIAIATVGWPGSAVFEARATLVRLALPGQLQFLGLVGAVAAIAYYGRLIAVGLLSAGHRVGSSEGERPRWPASPATAEAAAVASDPARVRAPRSSRTRAAKAPTARPSVAAAAMGEPSATKAAPVSTVDRLRSDLTRSVRATLQQAQRLPAAWRLNRSLETSLLVMVISVAAIAVAFGGFGASKASSTGISLDAIVAPTPQLPILGNPIPSGPQATVSPSQSSGVAGPVGSASPASSGSPGSASSAGSTALPSQLTGN